MEPKEAAKSSTFFSATLLEPTNRKMASSKAEGADVTAIINRTIAPMPRRLTSGRSRRSGGNMPKTRPAFVVKLWTMVNDPQNVEFIHWMPDGKSFQVVGREQFERTVLPKYFKHSNFSSFVRQLNMYGWHKVQDVTSGAMQSTDENWQFQCPNFIRDREDLLDNIVRNKGSKGSDDEDEVDLHRILEEINVIKRNQLAIGDDLFRIRKDNEMLWSESFKSQERHKKHAETLDRILRFLASLYGSQGKLLSDIISPAKQPQRLLMPSDEPDVSTSQIAEMNPDSSSQVRIMSINSGNNDTTTTTDMRIPDTLSNDTLSSDMLEPLPLNSHALEAANLALTSITPTKMFPEIPLYRETQDDETNDHAFDQKLMDSSKDIDSLTRHIESQGSSLQQVQDWIHRIAPNYETDIPSPSSMSATGQQDPNFDVDQFLVDPVNPDDYGMSSSHINDFSIPLDPIEPLDTKKRKVG